MTRYIRIHQVLFLMERDDESIKENHMAGSPAHLLLPHDPSNPRAIDPLPRKMLFLLSIITSK